MAGRIPQSFIDDLLDRTDLVELIDQRIKLKKSGRNYTACCPFHDEKTPSFSVNSDKQFYYCFGCGAGGNAISFVMEYDRTSFVEAVEQIAHDQNLEVPRKQISKADAALAENKNTIYDLLEQANQWYQQQLLHHPDRQKVITYLKKRGLSGEISKAFELGFAPPGWRSLKSALGTDEQKHQRLIDGGMLIEKESSDKNDTYDRFRDRLIFPIRNNRGRTTGFGGRVLGDEKPKYLNSPETPVFHKNHELYGLYQARQANHHLERLIMVEGYMDVISLAQHGITCAVATLGTAAGSTHMDKVFRHTSEVVFCFDGDEAGHKAADRALEAVLPYMEAGRQARFLFLPDGEDPDTMVRAHGKKHFEHLINNSQSLSEYLYSKASRHLDMGRTDDRAQMINALMPQIKQMPPGTYRELVLRGVSEKTALPIDDLKSLEDVDQPTPRKEQKKKSHNSRHPTQTRHPPGKRQVKRSPTRVAASLLLLNPQLIHTLPKEPLPKRQEDDAEYSMLCGLISQLQKKNTITGSALIGQWLAKDQQTVRLLLALEHHGETDEQLAQEFNEAIDRIRQQKKHEKAATTIKNTKLNPNITLNEMSAEERANWLNIFDRD